MHRSRGRPDSIDSDHRSVADRRWPAGHCRHHLCDRFLLSDGHTPSGGSAHDHRRRHSSVGRPAWLDSVHGQRCPALFRPQERSLLEALARPSDEPGMAFNSLAGRPRGSRYFQGAVRRPRRESVHIGSKLMGPSFGSACFQLSANKYAGRNLPSGQ